MFWVTVAGVDPGLVSGRFSIGPLESARAGLCLGSPESAWDLSLVRVARVSSQPEGRALSRKLVTSHGHRHRGPESGPWRVCLRSPESVQAFNRLQVKCQRGRPCHCLGSPKSVGPCLGSESSESSVARGAMSGKRVAIDSLVPESIVTVTIIDDGLVLVRLSRPSPPSPATQDKTVKREGAFRVRPGLKKR